MALSPRDKGEVRALIDAAIGAVGSPVAGRELTADERLARLEAHVYNLDIENRLLRLAVRGQAERAAIRQLAHHLGVEIDLADDGQEGDG